MLITESQMNIGRSSSAMDLLDRMSYLTEAESVYAPAMVPIVENSSLQAHIVRLEDIVSFAESNGIEDLGYAVQLVCEASEIDPSTIAFSVQEDTMIADPEMASLASEIMNEGVRIAAVPVSESHPASKLADLAVMNLIESGNDAVFGYVLHELVRDDSNTLGAKGNNYTVGSGTPSTAIADQKDDSGIEAEKEKADGLMAKIKKYANKGRDFIAKYIAKLHDWAKKINQEMTNVDPEKRTILQSIKKKITGAIAWLTARLSKIGTEGGGNRRENPEYWDKKEEKKA